jgi:hypothetical protein
MNPIAPAQTIGLPTGPLTPPQAPPTQATLVKVAFLADGSVVYGTPAEDACTIQTRYGELRVPWPQVVAVEVGYRTSPETRKLIAQSLEDLTSDFYQIRKAAYEELLRIGPAAAPALRKALKQATPELAERGQELLMTWNLDLSRDTPDPREFDRVITETMTIVGRLSSDDVSLNTRAFGKLTIRWVDLERFESSQR